MLRALPILLSLLALAGCASKSISEMDYTEKKALAAKIGEKCRIEAGHPDSAEFRSCFETEAQAFDASVFNNRRRMAAVSEALSETSASMNARMSRSAPTNCTTNNVGGTLYTSCY